jgi:PAS domain S-box-containing protein
MYWGIKKKVLLVLVGMLALTTALNAGLSSYYTNRQNETSAFAALHRDLLAWQNDLQVLTRRLKRAALSASGDPLMLSQLTELVTLESNIDDPARAQEFQQKARTLAYSRAVSLNRIQLVLQTGDFSSIAVYTGGKLSHFVSVAEKGMMVRRGRSDQEWVATANTTQDVDFQNWPAWAKGEPPPTLAPIIDEVKQPTVSFTFPSREFAAIDVAVPVEGIIEETINDVPSKSYFQLVSGLSIADPTQARHYLGTGQRPKTLVILVFRKEIDQTALEELATKFEKWPALFSSDGNHELRLTGTPLTSKELLRKAQAVPAGRPVRAVQQTTGQGSFYEALLPWQFDNQTRLILGLTSSRESTLQNIWQTVSALLIAASLFLVISIGLGTFWMGRFIDPIIALTKAVKQVTAKRHDADDRSAAEQLRPIVIEAPDEIGELSAAFNVMIAELRHAMETLEQRVQTRTAELRQQTRYLRALVDTLPLWVWLKDTQRRYLATNQANASACGRTVEDMIGKTDQGLWPPAVAERYCADDMEVMRSHQRKTVEEPITGPDGVVWMEIYRAPVLDDDGAVLGIVGAARNISERKAAEEAREKALAEAVRLAAHRSAFLAQMSHELRTPLNAILGYAQILRRDPQPLTRRQASGLETIQESGQHLLNLINDILDMARSEVGKLALYPIETNLPTLLHVVTDIIRVKADEKSLLFTYQPNPDLPAFVKADDKRLRQVLFNLLGNAIKFTDRGAVVLRVQKLGVVAPENDKKTLVRLRFEVEDSGIGMNEEQLAHIFEPFEQVGEVRRREGGAGLGLAISQQLVHLMGGHIEVKSRWGKGSRFWFDVELPVVATVDAAAPVAQVMAGYAGPRKKVLVVDDVPQNRIMLMDALSALGFEVSDAENGQECLEQLDSINPDLIIMDVMMPVLNGWEATSRIRHLPAWAGIPIIVVTASATSEDEMRSYTAGANAFLPKPIEHESLFKTMGELLSLQWLYQDSAAGPSEVLPDSAIPPREEIEQLYQLARLGNMQRIQAQANHLQELDVRYAPLAIQLRKLAENYQSKAIVALVELYRTNQEKVQTENPPA